MAYQDRARFYDLDEDVQYPSVTTILDVIGKPALGPWYAKVEREALLGAMREALTGKVAKHMTRAKLIAFIEDLAKQRKAADHAKDRAANIGNQAHKLVEWAIRRMLNMKVKDRPEVGREAQNCFESWRRWFKASGLKPIATEKLVYCHGCGYAGTLDLLAEKKGKLYVFDWKTGKAIYHESFLQNVAYRHALTHMGFRNVVSGAIVRLPKEGGKVEVKMVPREADYDTFLAALTLWKWQRLMAGQKIGDSPRDRH